MIPFLHYVHSLRFIPFTCEALTLLLSDLLKLIRNIITQKCIKFQKIKLLIFLNFFSSHHQFSGISQNICTSTILYSIEYPDYIQYWSSQYCYYFVVIIFIYNICLQIHNLWRYRHLCVSQESERHIVHLPHASYNTLFFSTKFAFCLSSSFYSTKIRTGGHIAAINHSCANSR